MGHDLGSLKALLLRLPVEESAWLFEQRAAVVTKPGARRPCLAKKDPILRPADDRRLRKDPQHRSRCLDGNVESVNGKRLPQNAA